MFYPKMGKNRRIYIAILIFALPFFRQLFMSAITCFGGGVILTTSLTHMLPEVNLLMANNIKHGQFPQTGDGAMYLFQ
jgi:hypothetical protein